MKSEVQRIQEFAAIAERLCAFVEGGAKLAMGERLVAGRELLAQLVVAGCDLPRGRASGAELPRIAAPTGAVSFDEHDIYWQLFDPYEFGEAGAGMLSDDFADIYCDLAPGLVAYEAGREGAAAWQWRFGYENHWGHHAVSALRALHWACKAPAPA